MKKLDIIAPIFSLVFSMTAFYIVKYECDKITEKAEKKVHKQAWVQGANSVSNHINKRLGWHDKLNIETAYTADSLRFFNKTKEKKWQE